MTEELKSKIQKLRLEKKFEEIIKLCDEVIKKDDKDEDAYFFKGVSLLELKQYYDAICNFNKVIELNPNDEESYYNIGNCKFDLKNYEEAIKYFDKVLELNPNNEKAYINRGLSKSNLKMYEEAINDFNKVIGLNPNNEKIYISRGFAKSNLEMYKEAIDDYNRVIELNPNNEIAYISRGFTKSNLEMYKEAIDDYNRVIELNSNNEMAYISRGFAKSNLRMYEEAINDFNKSIELNPNDKSAYFNRGLSKSNLRMYEEAINDFNKVIELDPNDNNAYFNRGLSKSNLRMYEEAINDFNKSIELNPNDKSAYLNIGVLKSNLKKYEKSIDDFNKAIELDPNDNNAYLNRGLSNLNLEKYEEAINDYNKLIELNNKNEYAYLSIVFIQINLKKYRDSITYINKAIKLNNNKYWYYLRFISRMNLGEYKKAISDINNFIYLDEKHLNIPYIILIFQSLEKYYNIDKLFILLTDINNNNLWENESITTLLSRFDESKNFNDEFKKNIKYLLLYEYFLLKILTFDIEKENNNIEISHYTSLDILPLLLNLKANTKESGNIRINNITTANDPKEGKILERIFDKNNIDIKIENDEKALTLQTSYSRNKDSLTMFRLYGKKENKEATGICLVLDNKYFNNSYTPPYSYEHEKKINYEMTNELITSIKIDENTTIKDINDNIEIPLIQKRNLYWVLYYNEKENQLIYNKEKSKYASNIIDLNDLVDNIKLKEDDKKEDLIKYAFAKIFYYTKEIKKEVDKNYQNIKNQLYSYLFENIKYIIKHEAFFEEQELRMLVTNDYKSDEILIDNDNKKLYIDYMPLFDERNNYIKEIIIGSKVENNEAVAEYIRKVLHTKNTEMNKLDDIKVSISEAPLR
ncbi:tetratricopeptide repeat protein [Brachyspira pilosicoli]|uniref:tetratricopeptide repeat protein n=1 Tax=Brachyspira pilosicoli TaxID=52584 RepID=UPI00300473C8